MGKIIHNDIIAELQLSSVQLVDKQLIELQYIRLFHKLLVSTYVNNLRIDSLMGEQIQLKAVAIVRPTIYRNGRISGHEILQIVNKKTVLVNQNIVHRIRIGTSIRYKDTVIDDDVVAEIKRILIMMEDGRMIVFGTWAKTSASGATATSSTAGASTPSHGVGTYRQLKRPYINGRPGNTWKLVDIHSRTSIAAIQT